MTSPVRLALLAAGAAAAGGALLAVAVVAAVGESSPTTTTMPPVEALTLVPHDAPPVLARWRGTTVRTEDVLARRTPRRPYPVVVDPALAARERGEGRSVTRLAREVAVVASAFAPVAEDGRSEVALAAPPRRNGRGLEVPVLVFNTAGRERRLRHLDLRLLDGRDRPVTKRARFLEGEALRVPSHTAFFALVAYGPRQVTSERPPSLHRFEARVRW